MGVVFSRLLQTIKLERDAFVWMDFNDRATGDAAILVAITQVLLAFANGVSLIGLLNPATLIRPDFRAVRYPPPSTTSKVSPAEVEAVSA